MCLWLQAPLSQLWILTCLYGRRHWGAHTCAKRSRALTSQMLLFWVRLSSRFSRLASWMASSAQVRFGCIKCLIKSLLAEELQFVTVHRDPILIRFSRFVCFGTCGNLKLQPYCVLFSACSPRMLSGWRQPLNPNHCWRSSGCLDSHCSDCICDRSTKDLCWISDPVMTSLNRKLYFINSGSPMWS